jgi:hypothetical protein
MLSTITAASAVSELRGRLRYDQELYCVERVSEGAVVVRFFVLGSDNSLEDVTPSVTALFPDGEVVRGGVPRDAAGNPGCALSLPAAPWRSTWARHLYDQVGIGQITLL